MASSPSLALQKVNVAFVIKHALQNALCTKLSKEKHTQRCRIRRKLSFKQKNCDPTWGPKFTLKKQKIRESEVTVIQVKKGCKKMSYEHYKKKKEKHNTTAFGSSRQHHKNSVP